MKSTSKAMAVLAVIMTVFIPAAGLAAPDGMHAAHDHAHGPVMADSHAPIGVMGDHTHKKGEWMLSYRYMDMSMRGMRGGTDHLTAAEVIAQGYMASPLDMTTFMHMFGAMYAPSDKVTLMAMLPYIEKDMRLVTGMGAVFDTGASGPGDAKLGSLWTLYDVGGHHVHLNAGISVPTGSINRRDNTPMAVNAVLPYPMQLGSGTWDLRPGVTYSGMHDRWSWGAQYNATLRLGRNDAGYTLGDAHSLTGWAGYRWADWISSSVRLTGSSTGTVDGRDSRLNPMMVPTADAANQGGERLDIALGVNLAGQRGTLRGHRLGVELQAPLYQNLNGPQMEGRYMLTIGWQKAF